MVRGTGACKVNSKVPSNHGHVVRQQQLSIQKYQVPLLRGTGACKVNSKVPSNHGHVVRQQQLSIQKYQPPPLRGTKTSKPNPKIPNARQIGRAPSPKTVREAPVSP